MREKEERGTKIKMIKYTEWQNKAPELNIVISRREKNTLFLGEGGGFGGFGEEVWFEDRQIYRYSHARFTPPTSTSGIPWIKADS